MTAMDQPPQVGDDAVQMADFAKFYEEATPSLIAFLRYLGASYVTAADCVQEAMLRALPPVWATLDNPRAWCRTTCRRLFLNEVSRRREDLVRGSEPFEVSLVSSEAEFLRIEEHHGVVELIRRLPERQRLVMACHFDGAKFEEIAELMGVTIATVRSTHRHAREKLAMLLAERDREER